MEDLRAYTPEEIILSNLSELAGRQSAYREQLQAHLRELADEISPGMRDGAAFLASLADVGTELDRTMGPEEADAAKARLACALCRLLPHEGTILQDWFFPGTDEISTAAHNRIAYQRSGYTDDAFGRFSAVLRDARATYPHTFRAVCDEVAVGTCEYCILPLESSGEGKLHAFASLIDAYSLKIAATCPVPAGDGRVTTYGLLRRSLAILRPNEKVPRLLEIRCDTTERSPEGILCGARICGLSLLRADWFLETAHLTFAPGGDVGAFLLFLSLACPRFEITGFFRHLE